MRFKAHMNPFSVLETGALKVAALVPIFFLPLAWASPVQSKLLLVSLILLVAGVVYAYAALRGNRLLVPKSPLLLAGAALILAYVLSALFSGASAAFFVSGTGEQDTVATIVLFFGLLVLGALGFSKAHGIRNFFRAMLAGTFALMALHTLHVFAPALSFGALYAATASVFGSWHEVGIIAGLSIFASVALWKTDVFAGYWKTAAAALIALSAFMLVVVNMRDVWMIFGGLMLAYALWTWYATQPKPSIAPILIAVVIAAASFGAAANGSRIFESLPAKFQVMQVEVRPSWEGTFSIGREAIDGPKTALFGSGPNSFTAQWSLYKPAGVNQTDYWNIDFSAGVGFIPTTFVTVGALGLFAWTTVLAALAWSARGFFRRFRESAEPALYAALFGSALYLAIFHIVYVPTASLTALTFIMLGAVAAGAGSRAYELQLSSAFTHGYWHTTRVLASIALLVALLVASLWTIRATVSDLLVNRSVVAYSRHRDAERALALVRTALFIYPNNDKGHRAAVELGLIRLGELAAAGATTDQATATLQVSLETTIQHGLAAVSINDRNHQNWLALASLYRDLAGAGVQGAYENARGAYERAMAQNPSNPVPLVQMAQLELALGNEESAMLLLNAAVGLKQDFAAAYLLRSQAHAAQGDSDSARADAAAVVQIAPEDPLAWFNLGSILFNDASYAEAAQALQQSVSLQNDYASALYLLAVTLDKLGRPEDALLVLERLAETNPRDAELQRTIGNIRARTSTE